jgi:hypothetical protein
MADNPGKPVKHPIPPNGITPERDAVGTLHIPSSPGPGEPGYSQDLRRDISSAIEQSERSSERAVSEPPPPQTADNAVRAFILLFALGFVLRGIDVMDHDMPNAIQKWVIAAILSIADYFYVPIRTALGTRFSNTAASVATDFRWWAAALTVILLGMSLSPYVEQRRWPFAWQIGAVGQPKQATVSTPIELPKPLGGQTIITGAQLVERVDDLQSQLDTTKKELESTNAELKVARQPPSSFGNSDSAPSSPSPETTNPLCFNGNCGPLSSPGNIFAIPSPGKIAELESAVRKLEEENRRLEKGASSAAAPASLPPSPVQKGPIVWNEDSQFLIVTGGGPDAMINSVLLQGMSTTIVSITDAYAVSSLTGHKQDLMANVQYQGYFPVNKVDIPAQAPVWLELVWKPPLSVRDFLDQWGKFRVTIVYNGITYEKEFDENYIRRKLQQQNAGVLGPHVTPRDDK